MEDKNKGNENDKLSLIVDEVLDWCETLVLYCFVALLIFTFVLRLVIVDGDSMIPTLKNKQKLIVVSLFYKPQQNDIVIFNNKNVSLEKVLVKRVIAVGGQKLRIDFNNGIVYVDNKILDEPYINNITTSREDYETIYDSYSTDADGNITIPEGYVFVMGDNRQNSTDSRSARVGLVHEDNIIGKAVFRLFPFKSFI